MLFLIQGMQRNTQWNVSPLHNVNSEPVSHQRGSMQPLQPGSFHPPVSLFFLLFLLFLLFLQSIPLQAATFTVNSGFDVNDLEPGNGLCVAYLVIIIPAVLPYCTLRSAIEEANALAGEDHIILGAGTYRLSLTGRDEDQAGSGDLDITDSVRIIGTGADKTFIDAAGLDRVFDIFGPNTVVSLSGVSIINGKLPPDGSVHRGGGLRNQGQLVINHVVISGNTLSGLNDNGGGIYNNGSCSIRDTTLHDNYAGLGGAIYNDVDGDLQAAATTLHHNTARGGGGIVNRGTIQLTNTTFFANTAAGTNDLPGGAFRNSGHANLLHCTIAGNSADKGGGGIYNETTLILTNTIVAGNAAGNCFLQNGLISKGGNLDSGSTCGFFVQPDDIFNQDPMLASLRNNGGPTPTMALQPGSPAIDAGISSARVATDQRGLPRPKRKGFDIGAFELNNFSLAPCITPLLLP